MSGQGFYAEQRFWAQYPKWVRNHADAKRHDVAKEMTRLLLELEWVSQETDMGSLPEQCMVCGVTHAWSSSEQRWTNTHAPDCALVTVLRAAGVLE